MSINKYFLKVHFDFSQHFENKLREMESKTILLNNLYKSKNVEYDEIQIENQSLKDELSILKTFL